MSLGAGTFTLVFCFWAFFVSCDFADQDNSFLKRHSSSISPMTSATVARVMNRLVWRDKIRLHLETLPFDSKTDYFALEAHGTSGVTVGVVLDIACSKDPRYRYHIIGEGAAAPILVAPIRSKKGVRLTNEMLVQTDADIDITSETVYNVLFNLREGKGLASGHLATQIVGTGNSWRIWRNVKVTLAVKKGWTIRDLLTAMANAMGDGWCWQVWGLTESGTRYVHFVRPTKTP